MRRALLTGLVAVGVLFSTPLVSASTRSNAPVDDATYDYWHKAQSLTRDQLRLLNRVEQAAKTPEVNRLKTLSGQIFLHTSAIDRFLKTNYPEPDLLCSPAPELGQFAGTDSASLEQVQVYCSLHRSTRDLMTMRLRLNQQAKLITPPVSTSPMQNHRIAEKPTYQPTASSYHTPITATNHEVLSLAETSRQRLAQMQPAFPEALRTSIELSIPTLPGQAADSRSR